MTDSPGDTSGDALVGTVLAGRYRILRRLGEGAMGAVYLGEHLNFGRKDAIKVLQSSMARDQEATRRFLRGARNASAINHPNVCTVYDFSDTEEGLQFLAMEYVEGETLADLLEREGALSPERAVAIVGQVAAALEAAHHLGIVHRDLKPGNIMLARDRGGGDLVKVVDFDIAKGSREGEGGEVTRLGFVVGTPEYMSPEQLTGDPLDGRSDIYSLGLVLFKSLTGRLPVRASSTQDLLVERLTLEPLTLGEVAPERSIPSGLQPVLDRALQRRREDRYESALDLAEALRAALTGGAAAPVATATPPAARAVPPTRVSGPPTRPPAAPPPTEPAASRRWLPFAAGGGAVVVALVLALVFALGRDRGLRPEDSAAAAARQLERLGEGTQEALQAAWDTAVIVAGLDGAPASARALAESVIGAVTLSRGDTAESARRLEAALALDPSRAEAGELLARIRGGSLTPDRAGAVMARQMGRLDRPTPEGLRAAADTATLIVEMAEVPADVRAAAALLLGRVNVYRGDTAAALGWLDRSLELEPDGSEAAALRLSLGRPDPGPGPGPVESDSARRSRGFGPAEAEDVAFRQLDRLVDPTPSQLRAAADTAAMIVDMGEAAASVRSVAAYVIAEVSVARGDTAQAIEWLQRAVALDPAQQGPRTLLNRLRGGWP